MLGLDKALEDLIVMLLPYVLEAIAAILVLYLCVKAWMIRKYLGL